jgi:tetratricopeptide (TPR) repeat protein/DNA-binding CsgD family transcriptional regulator
MHDKPMSSIEEIELRLAAADDCAERLALLDQLCRKLLQTDLERAREVIGRIEALASEEHDPRASAIAALRLGEYHFFTGDPAAARGAFRLAAGRLRKLGGDAALESTLQRSLGYVFSIEGKFQEALAAYESALVHARSAGDDLQAAEAYRMMSDAWRYLGDYSAAIDAAFKGLHLCSMLGNCDVEARALNGIAITYCMLEEWENALDYYRRCLVIYRRSGDRAGEGIALMNIGGVYLSQSKVAEAIEMLEPALVLIRKHSAKPNEADLLSGLGKAYGTAGHYDRALECFEEAGRMFEAMANPSGKIRLCIYRAELYSSHQAWTLALDDIVKGMELARTIGYARLLYKANKMAAELYERLGDVPRSLHCYKEHLELGARLQHEGLRRKLTEAERQAAQEQAERESAGYRATVTRLEEEMAARQQELMEMALRIVQKDEFIGGIREQVIASIRTGRETPALASDLLRRIRNHDGEKNQWRQFEGQFNRLYQGFTPTLLQRYHLTPSELKICMLLRLGFATKEIADILHIAIHTAETHRRHIRKKLALSKDENLATFLASFDAAGPLMNGSDMADVGSVE